MPQTPAPTVRYLSPLQAAKIVGVGPRLIRLWVRERGLPGYNIGTGNGPAPTRLLVKESELVAFVESRPSATDDDTQVSA